MKDGVIPGVLAKESLNFELWLQRYGEKKFRDLFVISGKWLGPFLELFLKIRGASCKYVGSGLILEMMRGLSAKCQEMGFLGIILLKKNQWTMSTDWWTALARPPWTDCHCRARDLTGARPPAALVLERSDQRVRQEERSTGVPVPGSPRLRMRRSGGATTVKEAMEERSTRARSGRGERGRSGGAGAVGGADVGRPFIGSERERGGRASERNGRRRWCAILVMKVAILEGDQTGSDEGGSALAVMGVEGGGAPRGGSAHVSRWWRRRGRAAGGGRRRAGARASVRERDGLGRADWEAKAQEEWGESGLVEGQGLGGWAKNLSWAQFKK
jgi:hypothetical protein